MNRTIKTFFLFLIYAPIRALGRIYGSHRRAFFLYLLLIALILGRGVHYGFLGDESGYVTVNTEELARHPWLPIVTQDVDTGHPMLYAYLVALYWRVFGHSNAAANVSMWIWAAVALVALHRLMEAILEPRFRRRRPLFGAAAALALCSTPLFISLAAQYLDPIPYLALLLCAVLAWVRGRRVALTAAVTAMVLVRMTACLSVLGLGLFDLAYSIFVLRRRSRRAVALALAPYAFSAAVLFLYLFVKMYVLKRPMSTIEYNKFVIGNWGQIRISSFWVLTGMFSTPYYSFKPLLAMGAVGGLAALVRAIRRKYAHNAQPTTHNPQPTTHNSQPTTHNSQPLTHNSQPTTHNSLNTPGATAIYGACIASMAVPTLFYFLYPYYPHPRYLLAWHAFFVLLGVHGLVVLFGRRPWLALLLLAPWCGLQVARWHVYWTERIFSSAPQGVRVSLRIYPGVCLDVQDRKKMCHDAARWIEHNPELPGAVLICGYPTQTIFRFANAGFIRRPANKVYMMSVLAQEKPETLVRELIGLYPATFLIHASWDAVWGRRIVDSLTQKFPFKLLFYEKNSAGDWFEIFYCPGPAAPQAGGAP